MAPLTKEGVPAFKSKYSIPEDVQIRVVGDDEPLVGTRESIPIYTRAITEGGVRFPLHPLLLWVLSATKLCPIQCCPNFFRIVMGVAALNNLLNANLGLWEMLFCYILKTTGDSYSLAVRRKDRYLVTHLPYSNKGPESDVIFVSGNWEYKAGDTPSYRCPYEEGMPGETVKGKIPESSVKMDDLRKVWSFNESLFCRAAHVLLGYTPTYHSFIAIPNLANATLVEDKAKLQAHRAVIPRSRQKTDIPSRKNRPVKNFLSFVSTREPCEATPSTLHALVESSSLPTPAIDLTLIPNHAPTSADPQVDIEASVPPEPATDDIPVATPIISSPPRLANVEPEDHLTKKRRMETHLAPKRSIPAFCPVLKAKGKEISIWDSAAEDMNVAVGIAKGVILPRDLAINEAALDNEIARQAIQQMVLGLQKVHEVGARITRKNKAMKKAIHDRMSALAKKESIDKKYAKLCEEMLLLQAQSLSLKDEKKKLAKEVEDLKASESSLSIDLSQTQLEHSSLLEDFDKFKAKAKDLEDGAFDQGMEKAERDLALQIPSLERAYFAKGWIAALKAADMPPTSELFLHPLATSYSGPPTSP